MAKRIASAVCVLGVVAVCFGIVGYRNNLKADETYPVVTRGVIDHIEQIPETKRTMYDNDESTYEKGTKENPFLILEIVPYEEIGHFGYQIGGCEPLDIDSMRDDSFMYTIGSFHTAKIESQGKSCFFSEELKYVKYSATPVLQYPNGTRHKGYYELVENGQGDFLQNADRSIVKAEGGNIIWHTLGSKELEYDYPDATFQDIDESTAKLKSVGQRIFTYREETDRDPVYAIYNYMYYRNNENFLKNSMGLSDEEANNYSVIIKTITPSELNAKEEWVKYADLFVVTPQIPLSGDWNAYKTVWEKYNWYQHKAKSTSNEGTFENVGNEKDKDISWNVALAMYNKINADKNYAPIIMASTVYMGKEGSAQNGTLTQKKEIKTEIFDWNMNFSGVYDEAVRPAYNNNMYKLAIMLFSMKPELFKKIYLDEKNPLIVDGKFIKPMTYKDNNDNVVQDPETAQSYWTMFSFFPTDANGELPKLPNSSWYAYWTSQDKWEDYGMAGNITEGVNQGYINDRVFIHMTDNSTLYDYLTKNVESDYSGKREYTDFKNYMDEENPNGHNSSNATVADAIHYILGNKSNGSDKLKKDINILDIEPCYDSKNGYTLKESYIHLLMPYVKGKVNIKHMTTAEFIGNNEDLNSTYDLIYMGLDDGAYNKDENGKTTWNDSAMNGKIYFHTGDVAKSAPYWDKSDNNEISHSVKFLWLGDDYYTTKGKTQNQEYPILRFPGNDITKLKMNELNDFMKAGLPIVAISSLYNNNQFYIDQNSNVCAFVKGAKSAKTTFFKPDEGSKIEEAYKNTQTEIEWVELPNIYNGGTEAESDKQIDVNKANYLSTNTNGRSILPFQFKVTDPDTSHKYKCRIYIDQNRDGKFGTDEVFYEGKQFSSSDGIQGKELKISKLFVGFIQWKIEVYRAGTGNDVIRFTKTGCSAAKKADDVPKIAIKVLQITPNNNTTQGYLNLSNDTKFTEYYNKLNDYTISVETKTVGEYEEWFKKACNYDKSKRFSFDESKGINIGGLGSQNPINYKSDLKKNMRKEDGNLENLYDDYNMIIVGFGDCYGMDDISNEYGAVDFLKFFAAKGKSILFTHDLTSMNNVKVDGQKFPYGYSANALLRDLMGMNRYKSVSNQLNSSDREKIVAYQKIQTDKNEYFYDTVTDVNGKSLDEIHGFTYYEIKHLGYDMSREKEDVWNVDWQNWKMPYQYMIKDVNGNSVCNLNWQTKNTGFNDENDETTLVSKTNEGQITQYPYKIGTWEKDSNGKTVFDDSKLSVAKTHGQYYQLNMEDPDVTVWYCLADDKKDEGTGTAKTYGVSPNDAANNYYIYSKGNIFYSGVGHNTVNGDMEAKLFINTIIGAYRVSYEPPIVEILNSEAEIVDSKNLTYDMNYNQEYNENNEAEKLSQDMVQISDNWEDNDRNPNLEKIRFSPVELNAITTKLKLSIYYVDEQSNQDKYVTTIYHVLEDGTIQTLTTNSEKNWRFDENINSMDEYFFYYPKAYLNENWKDKNGVEHPKPRRTIMFDVNNNKIEETGHTTLNMKTQALFMLD